MKRSLWIFLIFMILLSGIILTFSFEKQGEYQSASKLTEEELKNISEVEINDYCGELREERKNNTNLATRLPVCGSSIYNITETAENFEVIVYLGLSYEGGHKGSNTLKLIIDRQGNILEKNF